MFKDKIRKAIKILAISMMTAAPSLPIFMNNVPTVSAKFHNRSYKGGLDIGVDQASDKKGTVKLTSPIKADDQETVDDKTIEIPAGTKLHFEQDSMGVQVWSKNKKYGKQKQLLTNNNTPASEIKANKKHHRNSKAMDKKGNANDVNRNGKSNKSANGKNNKNGKDGKNGLTTKQRAELEAKKRAEENKNGAKGDLPRTAEAGLSKPVAITSLLALSVLLGCVLTINRKHDNRDENK